MRIAPSMLLGFAVLLSGCRHIDTLTHAECRPANVPGEVVLQREAFLYRFDRDRDISMMDNLYTYVRDHDANGKGIVTTKPPLQVLPVGTRLSITGITRETGFDDPYKAIYASGIAHGPEGDLPFHYVWGLDNKIMKAPWESPIYAPREQNQRVVDCNDTLRGPAFSRKQ
jgi:hypothetical protein